MPSSRGLPTTSSDTVSPDAPGGNIFDMQRWSTGDGPGIRTTVFFKGCPLRCAWCCNPESWSNQSQDGIFRQRMSAQAIIAAVERDRIFFRKSGGGVTFSGGEPTCQSELLHYLARRLGGSGIHLALETCGHFSWSGNEAALKLMDLVYFDLKHMDSAAHERLTGVGNALILENAVRMATARIPMIVRMPLIPGWNDSVGNLEGTARFVGGQLGRAIPIEIMPYHILGRHKHKAIGEAYAVGELEPPSPEAVDRARGILEASGAMVMG